MQFEADFSAFRQKDKGFIIFENKIDFTRFFEKITTFAGGTAKGRPCRTKIHIKN